MNKTKEPVNRQDLLNIHKCQSCAFRTNSQHVILSHLKNHHLKLEFKEFSCKSANLEVYKCQFCYFESDLKIALCRHKSLVHGTTHCSDPEIKLKSYICDKCGFETYSLIVFSRHVCDDSRLEEFSKRKCFQCEHLKPDEIKWLECVQCSFKTKNKESLNRHISTKHVKSNEIKWLECEQCTYKTRRMRHLKGHIVRDYVDPDEGESNCKSKHIVSPIELHDINVHDSELTDAANGEENQSPTDIYTTPAQSLRKNSSFEKSKNLKSATNRTQQKLTSRGYNVQSSNRGRKKYFCIFCKRLTGNLPRHLEIKHKEEPEVQEISCLRKGSLERKNLIERIRKKGIFEYNCSEDYNTERELIVSRRPQHNKGRIDRHYECCSNCHGFFSKLTLRRHFRKCAQNGRKGERNIMIAGRRARQMINNNIANNELKNEVLPILRDDRITDAIRTNKLLLMFGNKMLEKSRAKYNHKMIRSHLRCLGRFLVAVKDKYTEINELSDVYNVKYYDSVISTIKELSGLDHTSGKYKVPSYVSRINMLIKKVGNLLITECVKQKNNALKMTVKDFLELFSLESVNKIVKENLLEIRKDKGTELPTLKILSSKQNQENYNSEHNVSTESETTLIQNSLHTSYQPTYNIEYNIEFDNNDVIMELEIDSHNDTTITGRLEKCTIVLSNGEFHEEEPLENAVNSYNSFNSSPSTSTKMSELVPHDSEVSPSSSNDSQIAATRRGKKGKNKVAWSLDETKLLEERFAEYLKKRKLPSRDECEQLMNEHPFLKCRGRTVPKIKAWVCNYIRRLRLGKSNDINRTWTTLQKAIIHRHFEQYFKNGNLPSADECRQVLQQYPVLQGKKPEAIKSWIHAEIKRQKRTLTRKLDF